MSTTTSLHVAPLWVPWATAVVTWVAVAVGLRAGRRGQER